MARINIIKAFCLNLKTRTVMVPEGVHDDLDDEVAGHWYTALHVGPLPTEADEEPVAPPDAPADAEGGDRTALKAEAEALGIEVDGRWGIARLRSAVASARTAP